LEKGTTLANGQAIANSGGNTERCAWLTSDTASNPGIVGNAKLKDSLWSSWRSQEGRRRNRDH
jgi:hypothetical protein